jgi:hypothetical protein
VWLVTSASLSRLFSSFPTAWPAYSVTLDLARWQQAYALFGAFMTEARRRRAPTPSRKSQWHFRLLVSTGRFQLRLAYRDRRDQHRI